MTKKKTEMTPEQHSRTKALALAWRQANREQINARQRAKRASERDARKSSQPVVSQEEAERVKTEKRAAIAAYKQQWRLENIDRVRARRKAAYQSNKSAAVASASAWNRVKADNRIANLREVSRSQNVQNTLLRANNKSGQKGVYWKKEKGVWGASIAVNGKQYHLGYYLSLEAASAAYKKAAARFHTHNPVSEGA